jgi:hypothetical protein
VDLAIVGARIAIEYDGAHHLSVQRQARDALRRQQRQMAGWIVVTVNSRDIHDPHRLFIAFGPLATPATPPRTREWHFRYIFPAGNMYLKCHSAVERCLGERVTGIEPALSAWEADVLPLNYTREVCPRV